MAVYSAEKYSVGYTVQENAAPHDLVFLNGNLAASRWWLPTVEQLKANFSGQELNGRMIFIELPGCGEGASEITGDLDIPTIAQQYMDILKSLNVTSGFIIGHSTGGLLASWIASLAPETFKKVLLLDPVPATGIQFDDLVLKKYEEMKTDKNLTAAIIAFTIYNCDTDSAFFKDIILEDTYNSVNKLGAKIIRALRGFDSTEQLKKIKADVTVLFGDKDVVLPKEETRQLTQIIPTSRFIEVPNAGHCLNIENPKLMASYIQQYLFS